MAAVGYVIDVLDKLQQRTNASVSTCKYHVLA